MTRTCTELFKMEDFLDRFNYLKLHGSVGDQTFGYDRWMNQRFYKSREWRNIRDSVIVRDNGCDLGVEGRDIVGRILIHHMNPIRPTDIIHGDEDILNPEYLICVTHNTHNAIHYGDESLLVKDYVERRPGDTVPWRS